MVALEMVDEPEEWRKVADWNYEVSSLGRIRRINAYRPNQAVVLKQQTDWDGYKMVTIWNNAKPRTVKVSLLVCEVFHGPKPGVGYQAAHWDGDKSNNRPSNVRWATRAENDEDAKRLDEHYKPKGELHPMHVLTEDTVRQMRRRYADGESVPQICAALDISLPTGYDAVRGTTWPHIIDPPGLGNLFATRRGRIRR
jgi:hypothetical protein